MLFIKLTEKFHNDTVAISYIDPTEICYMRRIDDETTIVYFKGRDTYISVKESPDEILDKVERLSSDTVKVN